MALKVWVKEDSVPPKVSRLRVGSFDELFSHSFIFTSVFQAQKASGLFFIKKQTNLEPWTGISFQITVGKPTETTDLSLHVSS